MNPTTTRKKNKLIKEEIDRSIFELVLQMSEESKKEQIKPFYFDYYNYQTKPPPPNDPKWKIEKKSRLPFSSPKSPMRGIFLQRINKQESEGTYNRSTEKENNHNDDCDCKGSSVLLYCRPDSKEFRFTCNFPNRLTIKRRYELVIFCPSRKEHYLEITHPSLDLEVVSINKKISNESKISKLKIIIDEKITSNYFSISKNNRFAVFSVYEKIGNGKDVLRFFTKKFIVTKKEGKKESKFWNFYKSRVAPMRNLGSPIPKKLIQRKSINDTEEKSEKRKSKIPTHHIVKVHQKRKNVQHPPPLYTKKNRNNVRGMQLFQTFPIFQAIQNPIIHNYENVYKEEELCDIHKRRLFPNYYPIQIIGQYSPIRMNHQDRSILVKRNAEGGELDLPTKRRKKR